MTCRSLIIAALPASPRSAAGRPARQRRKGSCGGAAVRSPARSFAERARGLRAASAAPGTTGPRVAMREGRRGRVGGRKVAGAAAARPAACGHELLDDAVLEGMEGDDGEPPAGPQDALGAVQRAHQFAEFVVDGDAQGLERRASRDGCRPVPGGSARRRVGELRASSRTAPGAARSTMARATARARRSSP